MGRWFKRKQKRGFMPFLFLFRNDKEHQDGLVSSNTITSNKTSTSNKTANTDAGIKLTRRSILNPRLDLRDAIDRTDPTEYDRMVKSTSYLIHKKHQRQSLATEELFTRYGAGRSIDFSYYSGANKSMNYSYHAGVDNSIENSNQDPTEEESLGKQSSHLGTHLYQLESALNTSMGFEGLTKPAFNNSFENSTVSDYRSAHSESEYNEHINPTGHNRTQSFTSNQANPFYVLNETKTFKFLELDASNLAAKSATKLDSQKLIDVTPELGQHPVLAPQPPPKISNVPDDLIFSDEDIQSSRPQLAADWHLSGTRVPYAFNGLGPPVEFHLNSSSHSTLSSKSVQTPRRAPLHPSIRLEETINPEPKKKWFQNLKPKRTSHKDASPRKEPSPRKEISIKPKISHLDIRKHAQEDRKSKSNTANGPKFRRPTKHISTDMIGYPLPLEDYNRLNSAWNYNQSVLYTSQDQNAISTNNSPTNYLYTKHDLFQRPQPVRNYSDLRFSIFSTADSRNDGRAFSAYLEDRFHIK